MNESRRVRQAVAERVWFGPDLFALGASEPDDVEVRGIVVRKALEGVRVPDMTHVQSGPSWTQILAFSKTRPEHPPTDDGKNKGVRTSRPLEEVKR